MGRKPAAIERTVMRVPVTFLSMIDELAAARGLTAPTFLESVKIEYVEKEYKK